MENSIDRYQRIANSTCSPMDEEMLGRLYSMQDEIEITSSQLGPLLERIDQIKKYIFYGKKPENVVLKHTPYAKLGEHMQMHATNQSKLDIVHGTLGWASEAGEIMRWAETFSQAEVPDSQWSAAVKNLKEESGDFAWYTAIIARGISVSLSEILNANNRKLLTRYKGKYSHDQAKVRDIEAEMLALDQTDAVVDLKDKIEIKIEFPPEMSAKIQSHIEEARVKLDADCRKIINAIIDTHNDNMAKVHAEQTKLAEAKSEVKSSIVGWLIVVLVISIGLPAFMFLSVVGIGIARYVLGQ